MIRLFLFPATVFLLFFQFSTAQVVNSSFAQSIVFCGDSALGYSLGSVNSLYAAVPLGLNYGFVSNPVRPHWFRFQVISGNIVSIILVTTYTFQRLLLHLLARII